MLQGNENDPNLSIICAEIVKSVPARSVYLCGSRATGQAVTGSSDYDIGVVMNTLIVPIYFRKLKDVERKLSQQVGASILVNPLPTFRIRQAKGNLLLFKIKREGVILYGEDFIPNLDPGGIEDLTDDCYFSYLFDVGMKTLIENFDPDPKSVETNEMGDKQYVRDAAKAMLSCGEFHLLLEGHYETKAGDMIARLCQFSYPEPFLQELRLSLQIRDGHGTGVADPLAFWFRVRGYILDAFRMLMQKFRDSNSEDIAELIVEYLNNKNKTRMSNLQYFVLAWLIKREVIWRTLLTAYSIQGRMGASVLCLLASIDRQGYIDRELLYRGYKTVKGYITLGEFRPNISFWKQMRDELNTYWPFAYALLGV